MKFTQSFACVLLFIMLLSLPFAGCRSFDEKQPDRPPVFTSYRDIPGVTDAEIAAIEAFRKQGVSFTYGMIPSTESFIGADGELKGVAVHMTAWLTGLFGIPFELTLHPLGELSEKLKTGEIDFTGYFMNIAERHGAFYMTDAIALRPVKYFRIAGSEPLAEIRKTRVPRYAIIEGGAISRSIERHALHEFIPVFIAEPADAYALMKNGEVDAFVGPGIMEIAFDKYKNIETEYYLPFIYSSSSISTRNPALAPFISVIQKALKNNALSYLNTLYKKGHQDFLRHKLSLQLTEEERAFINENPVIQYAATYNNYPMSFYDARYGEWRGIGIDVLREVEMLTGLKFTIAHETGTLFGELVEMLERGDVLMITELLRTQDREGRFLWSDTSLMTANVALISNIEHPNISVSDGYSVKIGVGRGTAYSEIFHRWFPNHNNYVEYESSDAAFDALINGEIDMVLHTTVGLLRLTNYQELSGYKVNVVFNSTFESTFGFNKDAVLLRSIVDKALGIIDIRTISEQWLRKTYDYRAKLLEERVQAQRPWIIAVAIAFLIVIIAMAVLAIANARIRKSRSIIAEQSSELAVAHKRVQLILDAMPFACHLVTKNHEIIDCNQEALTWLGISDKEAYRTKIFDCLPEFQPDGRRSLELNNEHVMKAFDEGYHHYEFMLQNTAGVPLPCEVSLTRINYRDEFAIVACGRDLREQKRMLSDVKYRSSLLSAVNHAAQALLTAGDGEAFNASLMDGMKTIGHCIGADRVEVWQNETIDGELHAILKHIWSSETGQRQPGADTYDIPYNTTPDWENRFSRGEIIRGPVSALSQADQDFYAIWDTKSVLIIPILMQDQFWGWCCIDDCVNARDFADDEVEILQSVSYMIANAIKRRDLNTTIAEANKRIETIINNLPGVVFQCAYDPPKYTYTFVSEGSINLFGYTPEELTGDGAVHFNDMLHPDDVAIVTEQDEALRSGLPFEAVFRLTAKDGTIKWI